MLDRAQRRTLEKLLGYRFRRKARLVAALTHPSFRHESDCVEEDNQRLEFLGDAALGLVAAAHLYEQLPDQDEGALTHARSKLANRNALARIGERLELGSYLQLGRGEERSGGRQRASNLTDAVEAVIGAIFLDGGLKAVDKVFHKLWHEDLTMPADTDAENPKGQLQEYSQKRWKVSPTYQVIEERGPAHAREYVCVVRINDQEYGHGCAMTKRAAEAEAAQIAMQQLIQSSTAPSDAS